MSKQNDYRSRWKHDFIFLIGAILVILWLIRVDTIAQSSLSKKSSLISQREMDVVAETLRERIQNDNNEGRDLLRVEVLANGVRILPKNAEENFERK
jgi:hypothetical protein